MLRHAHIPIGRHRRSQRSAPSPRGELVCRLLLSELWSAWRRAGCSSRASNESAAAFTLSEAMLGLFAALTADTPEITSAISAGVNHQHQIGTGVVLGSNVFNLAALLGLGALVVGRITIHRRVVVLTGAVALWCAAVSLVTVLGALSTPIGLLLVLAVLLPYCWLAATHGRIPAAVPLSERRRRWFALAMREEELEVHESITARRAGSSRRRRRSWILGGGRRRKRGDGTLGVVARERAGRSLGSSSAESSSPPLRASRTPWPGSISPGAVAARRHSVQRSTATRSTSRSACCCRRAILGIGSVSGARHLGRCLVRRR